ncbi:hypothetical protein DEO72_LG10g1003 [Vigna unguiculata]|uniref:Uncharacterized protein n=1 Tax=Vigna unguiculata TaxID=3917 RepID=A0A4D6N7I7_VIGUN|nr:hypothetical protein DEO72_LG10g1003 [Vigna unguiculata]
MRLSSLLVLFLLWNIAITNAIFFTNLEKGSIHPKAPNSNIIKGYQSIRFHELSKGPIPPEVNSNNGRVIKGDLLPYLSATTDRARAGIHATDHTPQRQGNLSGPIRTGHNQHTHTGHTRQPEPQLKGSSCSSAIPSHNSRDAIPSHNSRNTTCLTPIPSHNSRDTFRATTQGTPATSPLKHYQKPCRTPYEVQQLGLTASKPPSGGHVPLGATTSRPPGGGHVPPGAKRLNPQSLQPPPGGTVYTARRALFQEPLFVSPPPGGAYPTARRCISTSALHLSSLSRVFMITLPPSNKTSQGPMLSSPNYKTHTKTSVSVMPRHPNILALAHPIHHLYQSIPSTLIPMSPNFNQMHSFFFHQAPTDTQHSLNHNKPSLCTVTYVAWRPASRRQALAKTLLLTSLWPFKGVLKLGPIPSEGSSNNSNHHGQPPAHPSANTKGFHELSKGNVPPSHFSVNSNNKCVVKGYQSIRFHELPKGPIPPEGSSNNSNHHG